jgi:hypothetical protein
MNRTDVVRLMLLCVASLRMTRIGLLFLLVWGAHLHIARAPCIVLVRGYSTINQVVGFGCRRNLRGSLLLLVPYSPGPCSGPKCSPESLHNPTGGTESLQDVYMSACDINVRRRVFAVLYQMLVWGLSGISN